MHDQLQQQQQQEPLLQTQQAGDWSHGCTPQVADSLVCDSQRHAPPIRIVSCGNSKARRAGCKKSELMRLVWLMPD